MDRHSFALSHELLRDRAAAEQRAAWEAGKPLRAEEIFGKYPELAADPEFAVDIVYQEFLFLEQAGDQPSAKQFFDRFPDHAQALARQFELHQCLVQPGLIEDLQTPASAASSPDLAQPAAQTQSLRCPLCSTDLRLLDSSSGGKCPSCGRNVAFLAETVSIGAPSNRTLGKYELQERVGQGHFGEVWRAFDTRLRRTVALKMPRGFLQDEGTRELFLREGRALAQLQHPNIVPIFEAGIEGETVYIASAFVDGPDLRKTLLGRRFSPKESAQLCKLLADALHHAHLAGVIHRDLKPGNILIDGKGTPFITDFGLAKQAFAEEATLAPTNGVLGTPGYMSPEQASGNSRKVTPSSDIYSLGIILYELLTGQRPFDGDVRVLIHRIINEEPVSPRRLNRNVPVDLESICQKAIAKVPEQRYETAAAFADDLNRFLAGSPVLAKQESSLRKAARWTRRNAIAIGGSLTIAGLASFTVGQNLNRPAPADSRPVRRVRIATNPPGGEVTFIPLHPASGAPQPDQKRQSNGRPWAEFSLPPGRYLVVAQVEGVGFHEVWRRVPEIEAGLPETFPHGYWKELDGWVELRTIQVRPPLLASKMVEQKGTDRFAIAADAGSATYWQVPDFLIDRTEVTVQEYRDTYARLGVPFTAERIKSLPPPDFPMTRVSWDEAAAHAEHVGKRLASWVELTYSATNGGYSRFPWGDERPLWADAWTIGPVESTQYASNSGVAGLCSNAAEWTAQQYSAVPHRRAFGATKQQLDGAPDEARSDDINDLQVTLLRGALRPGLGFRCARSIKPRLTVEDFDRLVRTG